MELAQVARQQAEAAIASARLQLDNHGLRAPLAGVITARQVEAGEFVQPGRPLFELAAGVREILVKVEPVDAPRLRVGMPAQVSLEGGDGTVAAEHVVRIEPAIRREGNADYLPVWLSAASTALPLVLNQQVDVSLDTDVRQAAVRLPLEALVTRGGRHQVWRLVQGHLRLHAVELGALGDRYAEVRSGLAVGDRVVLPTGQALQEGMPAHVLDPADPDVARRAGAAGKPAAHVPQSTHSADTRAVRRGQ